MASDSTTGPHAGDAPDAIVVHSEDNVATAARMLKAGEPVRVTSDGSQITVRATQDIPFGHKLAVQAIPSGAEVRKYGEVIGVAAAEIAAGGHVHVHNVKSLRAQAEMLER